jgi:hypothetical protein
LTLWGIFTGWASVVTVFLGIQGQAGASLIAAFATLAMGSAPPAMLLRMARKLLRSGYGYREVLLALEGDLRAQREELAFERGEKRTWVDRFAAGLLYGGLGAMGVGTALAFIFDLTALSGAALGGIAALALGGFLSTIVGVPLAAGRGGRRPGLVGKRWLRFWESRVGKWLFNAAGLGLEPLPAPATAFRPTEMAIGMAAERLFAELPRTLRRRMTGLPGVVQRLEQHAQAMRHRIDELNGLLGTVGAEQPTGPAPARLGPLRDHVAEDLEAARDAAQARLQDAVKSLETIRLDLLRLHAGTGQVGGITEDLSKAGELAADLERLLEGREEVERALLREGPKG